MVLANNVQASKEVIERAVVLANERMRRELLPKFTTNNPLLAKLWRPLEAEMNGPTAYAMKFKLPPGKVVMQILQTSWAISATEAIVWESLHDAMLDEPEAFVTSLLQHLMGEDDG